MSTHSSPMTHDVLIIGSGAAGLTAALTLATRHKVLVLAKGALNSGGAAEGGGGKPQHHPAGGPFLRGLDHRAA